MATPEKESLARQILAASTAHPPVLAQTFHALAPLAKPIRYAGGILIDHVLPIYVKAFNVGFAVYEWLPTDLFSALMGLGLSFGGGAYCASIAAIEAIRLSSGWQTTQDALQTVCDDLRAVYLAHAKDDHVDADGDGVADVRQLTGQELMTRKLGVWAQAIKDPEKLSAAIGGLCAAWLAAQSVLRVEFAKTITLGVSIAEMATPMLTRICVPFAVHVLPKPYHHWIPLLVQTAARAIGVALAWRVQVLVSAVHLALRGGLLFSRCAPRRALPTPPAPPARHPLVSSRARAAYLGRWLLVCVCLCVLYGPSVHAARGTQL